jgi:hypothetical protein
MKIRNIFLLIILAAALSSCGARVNNPEELTVPILQAIKSDNIGKLEAMLPPDKDVNAVFTNNKGDLGWAYYNKYTKDYREKHLHARIRTCMDIIKTISAQDGLDWENVEYTAPPKKQDVSDSITTYTLVTTHLKFTGNKEYELSYKAAQADGKWYLIDDIYFGIKPAEAK